MPGATLGNGWGTRANLTGDPEVGRSVARTQWFNTAAFSAPAQYQFGSPALGIIEGPAAHMLDLGLTKSFDRPGKRYFRCAGRRYNALNKVNYGNPGTTLGTANFGRILSAGAARTMQLGVKRGVLKRGSGEVR